MMKGNSIPASFFLLYCTYMFGMDNKKTAPSATQYRDPTGEFPTSSLIAGKWYVAHHDLLHNMLVGVLLIWSILTLGYGLTGWGIYLFSGYNKTERILEQLTKSYLNINLAHARLAPRELKIGAIDTFMSSADKIDLVAQMDNVNKNWLAEVMYHFSYDGKETTQRRAAILPGKRQTVVVLGESTTNLPGLVKLIIDETHWQRIDPHKVSNPEQLVKTRLNFEVANVAFTAAAPAEGIPSNVIAFDVNNVSAYSFWEPRFHVLYFNNDLLVGVKEIAIEKFKADETRHIEISSLAPRLRVDAVELIPLINPFDERVYIPPSASL